MIDILARLLGIIVELNRTFIVSGIRLLIVLLFLFIVRFENMILVVIVVCYPYLHGQMLE